MTQTPSKLLTLDEFLQQPETKPVSEYIDGKIIQKPMPQGEHSVIQTDLPATVNAIVTYSRRSPSGRARAERLAEGSYQHHPTVRLLDKLYY